MWCLLLVINVIRSASVRRLSRFPAQPHTQGSAPGWQLWRNILQEYIGDDYERLNHSL